MAHRIIASARRMREVIEGVEQEADLHELVARYATARLYREPAKTTEALRKRVVRLMAGKYFPLARQVGVRSAAPVLEDLGGAELIAKGSHVRGDVLAWFKRYHRANLNVLETELAQEVGTLRGEIHAAFARARRDGVVRRQLVSDLLKADRDELARLKVVRAEIRKANRALARAQAGGDKSAVRTARQARTKAKAKIRTAKSFFARFETRVQARARDAIRREAQRAQLAAFKQAELGREGFVWVAVNGTSACPSCEGLHGESRSERDWRGEMPGDGHTYCGSACMCQLVPTEYAEDNDTLKEPLLAG